MSKGVRMEDDWGRIPGEETSELQQTDLSALLQTLSWNGRIFIIDIYRNI